ncbi:hypothetical protein B0H19DRAFT_1148444 [Mycena capillaripes]|nr:hypothetical protein B0H19DRAFT_1148444 [Mycena capillaripes]
MPASVDIAQELVDTILDFLYDDRRSLLSSSLIARKWVPATRHHLFEKITINHFFTGRAGHLFRDTAHSFMEISRSPHCTILPSIGSVVLNIDTDPAPTLLHELVDVLALAPVSKVLFIDRTSQFGKPISLSWITPHFPGLREFTYNSLDRFVLDVFTLVISFPELRSLSLYSNTRPAAKAAITQAKPYPTLPPAVFAHLRTLRLRLFSHQSEEFMAWLLSIGDQLSLETLDLNVFHFYHNGWGPVSALNAFLSANGAHLRDFSLCLRYEDDRDVDEERLLSTDSDGDVDLSNLTNLRSLRLNSHNVEAVCRTLASLPLPDDAQPQSLSTLEVSFKEWIHYDDVPCACDPRILVHDFAGVMHGDQFAHLTNFRILVPEFFGQVGTEMLRQYFPKWKDTKVLSVQFIDRFQYPLESWENVRDALLGPLIEEGGVRVF